MAEITDAMLASALKDLIKEGIVERKQYGEIPPRVEYSLTPKGESLKPIIEDLIKWSLEQYKNNNMCGGTKDGK
jgi:DNA-binding HxlR family transcriptional regulator